MECSDSSPGSEGERRETGLVSLTNIRYRVFVVRGAKSGSFADHGQKHHCIGTVDIIVVVSNVDVVVVVVILKDGGSHQVRLQDHFW